MSGDCSSVDHDEGLSTPCVRFSALESFINFEEATWRSFYANIFRLNLEEGPPSGGSASVVEIYTA